MKKDKLYTIGKFAEICDVSIKQIRYLEEKKLLMPKEYNAENKYRYYSRSQLEKVLFIKTLRELNVPFKDIVHIMENDNINDELIILQQHLMHIGEQMQKQLEDYRCCIDYIKQLSENLHIVKQDENKLSKYHVPEIIDVPRQYILFSRYRSNVTAEELFLERVVELKKKCICYNFSQARQLHAIFHEGYMTQFENGQCDLETFFVLSDNNISYNAKDIRCYGGFKALSCSYHGQYTNGRECYHYMEKWAEKRDIKLLRSSIEIYKLGPDLVSNPENYITQVLIPLVGSNL